MAIPHALAYGSGVLLGGIYPGNPAADLYKNIQENWGGNWLDDKYDDVANYFNPQPDMMAEGPLSRNSRANAPRRHYDGRTNEYWMPIPGSNVRKVWSADNFDDTGSVSAEAISEVAREVIPSHEIPGYDRMVNEGYDSWAPEPQESWRPDLAGTTDYSQWTEDNPVNIHYNSQGEPVEMYGWEGGIADISMLDYGIDVPGGMGLTPNANRTVFNSPYPGDLNEATIVREEVDNRSDWQKWKDSLKQGWEAK